MNYSLFDYKPNKRGAVQDFFVIMTVSLAVVIGLMAMMKVYGEIRTSQIYNNTAAQNVRASTDSLDNSWDSIIIFFITIALFTPIVAAFLIGSHPAFLWASVLVALIVIILAVVANNVVDKFAQNSEFSAVKAKLPKTLFFFDYFAQIMGAYIGILLIALYFGVKRGTE